jgi:FtsZ-binding cell division protein ZapB
MTEETTAVVETPVAETTEATATEVVKSTEVAPEADANNQEVTKASTCPDCGEAMDACMCDSKSDTNTEDSTEKAAKPHADEETSADMAGEKPGDEQAEDKKPMAPKSDEVVAEAVTENNDSLEKAFSDLVSTVKSLQAEVEALKVSKVDVDTAKNSFEAVAKDIASVSKEFNEFGKRVDAVEADTAFRKSGDLGEIVQDQPEMVEKSLWGGSFLKTADLFN